ncbi:MAG: type II secretion system protein [Lachnospiraceae bacterium]|nr:type II secretion system protein [Lachnospiraceae bacterium]
MKKLQNKLQEKLQNRKQNNKGFSLVELIIVIAIMAILVGIVGTQVIPYINKSRESKDQQIISSYCTAAVSAYSSNAGSLNKPADPLTLEVYAGTVTGDAADGAKVISDIKNYTYSALPTAKFSSPEGKKITEIEIKINPTAHTVEAKGVGATGDFATVKGDL